MGERGCLIDQAQHPPASLLTPGPDILRWYAEMGGERVTLGSDSHRPEQIGAGLEVALQAIQTAGLKYLTQFERRRAKLIPIDGFMLA